MRVTNVKGGLVEGRVAMQWRGEEAIDSSVFEGGLWESHFQS